MPRIMLESTAVAGIPVLTMRPAVSAGERCPVVFYIPGFTGVKEHGLALGYQVAQQGCCFVALDPLHHGERRDETLEHAAAGIDYPPETGLDVGLLFFEIIRQCVFDIATLIPFYAGDPALDSTRCGCTGPSMGGYASFLAFATLPEILAAVPMIGVPCFSRRWSDLLSECSLSNAEWAETLARMQDRTALHSARVAQMDPAPLLAGCAPRALFVMNNDFDTDQPKLYSIETVRSLQPAWADRPERLRLGIYPAAHTVTPQMERDAADWFARFLLQHPPTERTQYP